MGTKRVDRAPARSASGTLRPHVDHHDRAAGWHTTRPIDVRRDTAFSPERSEMRACLADASSTRVGRSWELRNRQILLREAVTRRQRAEPDRSVGRCICGAGEFENPVWRRPGPDDRAARGANDQQFDCTRTCHRTATFAGYSPNASMPKARASASVVGVSDREAEGSFRMASSVTETRSRSKATLSSRLAR